MLFQLEITTHCNFVCFYCAGRDMPQRHMEWSLFESILGRIPAGRHTVMLQGEGEPLTHPRFWDMVGAVRARGFKPHTITNGSHIDAERCAAELPRIAVSLDTVDPVEAERIGRLKLPRVLSNLERLAETMGPDRIVVRTVDYGQPLQALRAWLAERGLRNHRIQAIQAKDDYAYRYPGQPEPPPAAYHYRCRYIERPMVRFFDIRGRRFPCCFIKDAAKFVSTPDIRAKLAARQVPACCSGCREIMGPLPARRR